MMSTKGEVELRNELEDGELEDSDVEEGTYIPLERPDTFNPPSLVHMQIQDEPSDDQSEPESSCTDSDEDPQRRPKRTKVKPQRPLRAPHQEKKNKYNVWCKALEEDLLTEDMVGCDVTKKSCRYGVESYDYTIKYRLDDNYVSKKVFASSNSKDEVEDSSNKRRHSDRANVKLRLGKKINGNCHSDIKQQPRLLPDLIVTPEDSVESIAKDIAEKLSEEKLDLVGRIIQGLGASKAIDIYKETQRVEAEGGMLVMNGGRRRTPGGIYFFLLKRDDEVSQEIIQQIFNEDKKETARKIKRTRAKTRQKVMEQLKQSLTDSELPSLLSRGEATTQSEHGSNPPPSPATDARDCSSDTDAPAPSPTPHTTRPVNTYEDDDFLEVMCNDDMDLF